MPEETTTQTILGGGDAPTVDTPAVAPGEDTAKDPAAPSGNYDYSTMLDAQGFFAENWKDSLPEELRNEPCLDNVKNFATLTKSYVNSQKMIGKNKIAIPGDNATEEERNAFYSALGRPATANDYKYDNVKLPEGMSFDENAIAKFREFAFDHGVSQQVFEQAIAFDVERVRIAQEAAVAAHNQEYTATMNKLQEKYGDNLPARIAQVDKALTTFGIKDIFIEKALTNNFEIFEALANIGSRISESKLMPGEVAQNFKTPQQQIDDIYADKNSPIYQMDHPKHDATVAEVKRLMALVNKG